MDTGLAHRLREGTQSLHRQTERAGVMPALLRGTLPAACFHRMQRNLQAIYAALEPALQQRAEHPALAPLRQPALARAAALADDLDALHGPDWASALPLLPAAQAYAERLQRLAADEPALLAAHSYVRYLGDLSGGQALGRLVRQAYGLKGSAGSRFFDFGPPEQVKAMAAQFRSALDALPLDAAQQQAQVDEARWAFVQHERLFEELATGL
jgi:heme oxygenase